MKTYFQKKLFLLFLLILPGSFLLSRTVGAADIRNQKQELENIKKELENSREKLDSLKKIEQKIIKDVTNYEQQASMNKTVINRLNRQLGDLQKNITTSKRELENSARNSEITRKRFIGNLKYYYSGTGTNISTVENEISAKRDAYTRLVYLTALSRYDKGNLSRVAGYLEAADAEYNSLLDRERSVGNVRNKKRTEYAIINTRKEKRQKELSRLRRTKENESDRLVTLSAEALQMEDLITRLEKARQKRALSNYRSPFDFNTGNFATYKGALMAPLRGKITTGFGWKTNRTTMLKSFSPGIEIKGKKNGSVLAAAPGVVTYLGNLRGYGNFIILEHEDGFFSTYAGLDKLKVVQNQLVEKGKILGTTPSGGIKFELRQGRTALDPVEWLEIDSFK